MGYGICRVQKVKAAAVGSMQYHNDRLPGEHSNPNIDHSKRGDNAEFIKHGSYRAEVNDRTCRSSAGTERDDFGMASSRRVNGAIGDYGAAWSAKQI